MASLKFDSGPRTGEKVPLDKAKVTFGRGRSCDCVIAHPTVSREHFYLEHNNGKYFLVDQGSENGTRANGERISWIELKDGDEIKAGPFTLVFEMDEARTETVELPLVDQSPGKEGGSSEGSQFDATTSGMYAPQYLQGIEHFNAGRYFDAHEVWEEIWLNSSGDTKVFYQMLIQAAVGLHHYERDNSRGARGMHANVVEKLSRLPSVFMSLDLVEFSRSFDASLAGLIEREDEGAFPTDKPRPQIRLLSSDTPDWNF
jgi:pSer/pThr/pTyr-binding forkhead associated (FHA) protein